MISNSGHDENGKYSGGKAGDQTGQEWQIQKWYNRPWTVILRYPDESVRNVIASLAAKAAKNDNIGYNQNDRYSYWNELRQTHSYDPSEITKPCNADCSAGVAANVKAAGYICGIKKLKDVSIYSYTGNLKTVLLNAGFKALTESKYLTSDKYLLAGDILLYEGHHVATNLTNGSEEVAWYESDIAGILKVTATSGLTLRKYPDIDSTSLLIIPKGTIIYPKTKTQFDGKWWIKHESESVSGWLSMSYLRGWIQENDRWWYLLGNGEYDYYKSVVTEIDKKYYAFDKYGWMITSDRIGMSGDISM